MKKPKLIKAYNKALQAIYDHVGFKEDWTTYPIDDCTMYFWNVDFESGTIMFADTVEEFKTRDGNYYENELHRDRFYPKHVYTGKYFTLVFADTHTDGMKYLQLFDNKKILEITQDED